MSIMTLMAVYSTAPETILLFEENFKSLDEKKWERHTRDCSIQNEQSKENDDSNRYIDDGVLLFEPLFAERSDSELKKFIGKCNPCTVENNTHGDCLQGLSTTFKTKNSFQAKHGKVQVRLKLPTDSSLKASVGIILSNATTSEDEKTLEGFKIIETIGKENKNRSAEFKLFFGPFGNQTFSERTVTKSDFHIFEFEWENDGVEFQIDGEKAKKFELDKLKNSSSMELKFFGQPFNLYFEIQRNNIIEAEESLNLFKNSTNYESIMTNNNSSNTSSSNGSNINNNSSFVVDYVKIFKKKD